MYEQLRRLFRHSAAYTFGSMVNRAFAIVLVPLLTRFLTQAEYGDYSLLLGATAILWVAFDFGISASVTRFSYDYDDEQDRRRYIMSMWLAMSAIAAGVSLVLSLVFPAFLERLLGNIRFWPYIALTVWATFLNTANIIPKVLMRTREQSGRYVLLILGQSLVLLAMMLVFVVWLRMGLLGAIVASFIQCAAIYVFYTAYTLRNASWPPDVPGVRRSLSFGAPIIVLEAGWWILDTSDRYILRFYETAQVVALYSVGYALGRLLIMVSTSLDQAWTPFFFEAAKRDDAEARRLAAYAATYFSLFVAAGGLVIVVFAREAVLLFGGRAYLDAARVTPLIVLASVVQGLFYVPGRGLMLRKKTRVLPLIVLASGATNIGLNFALIPRFGMMGAAVATLVGYAVAVALTFTLSQRVYRIEYQAGRIASILAVLVAGTLLATLVTPGSWYVALGWKLMILGAAAGALWLLGFFEPRELAALRRLISERRRPQQEGT